MAVIAAKGASTNYWVKGLDTYVNEIFQFAKRSYKPVFALSLLGIVCWLMSEKKWFNTF